MGADEALGGYLLTPRAEADLEDIWIYSAETWSPNQADTYLDGLLGTIDTLVAMPSMARERIEFSPPVRIHSTGLHLVVYRIEGNHLLVIRILGGRQDWQAMLKALDT